MLYSLWRAVGVLMLVPYVALSSTVAPEHFHEADADHPHATVHRHFEPHHAAAHDFKHVQLADDDDHVVWLDSVSVHQTTFHVSAPQELSQTMLDGVPATRQWTATINYDSAPPHGPPRASASLRAPPSLSL